MSVEKKAVFTFGRFQPPHSKHSELIDSVIAKAEMIDADAFLFASQKNNEFEDDAKWQAYQSAVSPDSKKAKISNPLKFADKKKILEFYHGNKNVQIVNVVEKPTNPRSNLALIGIYYISSQKKLVEGLEYLMNNDIRTKKEYQLTDAFSIMIKRGHIFESLKIDTCMDCGVPEAMLSTNLKLLEMENNNAIHSSVIIENSDLYHCTISENCIVKDSNLNNVIMLEGSKVFNSSPKGQIIGFEECVDGSQS